MELNIISLSTVDKNTGTVDFKDITVNDAKAYISSLIETLSVNKNVREYSAKSLTSEVISQVLTIINIFKQNEEAATTALSNNNVMDYTPLFNIISNRLLRSQISAQTKYKQLTNIKSGNLIQALAENDDNYTFILTLVEHKRFVDDFDLKYKTGMLEDKNITLKSAHIYINKASLSIDKILLSDSNKKISEYWYDDFLELQEAKSNISNTKFAYNAINTVLNTLSRKYSADYSELKNALNVYFVHNNVFSFDDCVSFLLDNHETADPDLNLDDLRGKLNSCNVNNSFDNCFPLDTSAIKNKLQNTKYKVNDNIELKIKAPLDTIKENIYTDRLDNGEKVLIINNVSEKTLEQFNFNNIEL